MSSAEKLQDIERKIKQAFGNKLVFGYGNQKARIMLVGEAPGKEEEKLGKPFVGRSGRLLSEALKKAAIEREKIYITNVVKFRPPGNRKPKSDEIREFLPILHEEIESVKPKAVCLLGNTATEALLGKGYPVTKHRGKIISRGSRKFLITFHPAAILRNPNRKGAFEKDIRKLKNFI